MAPAFPSQAALEFFGGDTTYARAWNDGLDQRADRRPRAPEKSSQGAIDKIEYVLHTVGVAEPQDFPRRVFIEDLRRDGMFLRVTWHSEHSAFVVSHWNRDVCVAATRVAAKDVAGVVALLTNGLADALISAEAAPPAPSSRHEASRWTLWRRILGRLARDRSRADVIVFPERRAAVSFDEPRWKGHDG